jgi:predicted nucleotidyltransferase component of viral defense system
MAGRDDNDGKGSSGTSGYRRRQNMAASVRSRLTTLAHAEGEEPEYVLTRYAIERLLYRLGTSPYAGTFILKGALLFALWEGRPHRATRDLDLLGFGPSDVGRIEHVFHELCTLPVENDGLIFLPETVHARPIRDQQEYGGIRVLLQATLGTARLHVQADVGFGDVITPAAQEAKLPTLLDLPAPRLRVYPRETVVAEKFEAMVRLGLTNTRMKDFYDLLILARRFAFDGSTLVAAIQATFTRRGTDLPSPHQPPLALSDEFAEDAAKQAEWQGFLRRSKLESAGITLREVIEELRAFLMPLVEALAADAGVGRRWMPGGPWLTEE